MAQHNELPDVEDVPVTRARVLVAGLVFAAGAMLVAEMFMVLVLRLPELLLIGAPLTVVFVLTAGLLAAWATDRFTKGMDLRKVSLIFFAVGLVVGGLWGYPVFVMAINTAAQTSDLELATAGAIPGALYFGSTAGLGALVGRYFGPWAATRPQLVRTTALCVLVVAVIGVAVLSFVNLEAPV